MNESIYLQSNKKMVVMVPFTLRVTNIAGWKATILNGRYIDSFLVNFPASYVSGSRSVSSRELTYPQKMAFWVDDFPNFPRWDMWSFPGGYPMLSFFLVGLFFGGDIYIYTYQNPASNRWSQTPGKSMDDMKKNSRAPTGRWLLKSILKQKRCTLQEIEHIPLKNERITYPLILGTISIRSIHLQTIGFSGDMLVFRGVDA